MMKTPEVKESKADKQSRLNEQKRMEASQLSDTQALLSAETMKRIRRFGQLAGAATNLPGFIGSMATASTGGGAPGSSGGGLGGGGGRLGGFGGLQMGQL